MIRPWETNPIGSLPDLMAGGIVEVATVGSFSHVQVMRPAVANSRLQLSFCKIMVDMTATVRVYWSNVELTDNDGVEGPIDLSVPASLQVQLRSETNAAQLAILTDIMRIKCPGQVWVELPFFCCQSGRGLTLNPTVTGNGISLYAQWDEAFDFDPTGQI